MKTIVSKYCLLFFLTFLSIGGFSQGRMYDSLVDVNAIHSAFITSINYKQHCRARRTSYFDKGVLQSFYEDAKYKYGHGTDHITYFYDKGLLQKKVDEHTFKWSGARQNEQKDTTTTLYIYDAHGKVQMQIEYSRIDDGDTTYYSYNEAGLVTKESNKADYSSIIKTYQYDSLHRITDYEHKFFRTAIQPEMTVTETYHIQYLSNLSFRQYGEYKSSKNNIGKKYDFIAYLGDNKNLMEERDYKTNKRIQIYEYDRRGLKAKWRLFRKNGLLEQKATYKYL